MCSKFSVTDFLERNFSLLVPFFPPFYATVLQLHQHQKKWERKSTKISKFKQEKGRLRRSKVNGSVSRFKCRRHAFGMLSNMFALSDTRRSDYGVCSHLHLCLSWLSSALIPSFCSFAAIWRAWLAGCLCVCLNIEQAQQRGQAICVRA